MKPDAAGQRPQTEEQLRQAQKLERLGRLAGAVAHEFNNLLTVIQGYADLLLAGAGKGSTAFEYASEIRTAVTRGSALSSQLLAFSAAPMRSLETILVWEDEDGIRKLVQAMLERQGYRVLTADSAGEALQMAAKQPIDLFLTDVAIERSSGIELAGRLRAEQPGMKVLYLSSCAEGRVKGAPGREGLSFFLRKPFTEEALAQKVRKALDPPPAAYSDF